MWFLFYFNFMYSRWLTSGPTVHLYQVAVYSQEEKGHLLKGIISKHDNCGVIVKNIIIYKVIMNLFYLSLMLSFGTCCVHVHLCSVPLFLWFLIFPLCIRPELISSWTASSLCNCFCPDAKERTTRSFSVTGVSNYTSILLSKEDNRLYVGAREILFALNLSDISSVKLQRNVRMPCMHP